MPALGVSQETGRVIRWNAVEGETVRAGEELLEIETDKVTVSIEAPDSGVLAGVRAAEGEDVPVGQVIAFIVAPGEEPPAAPADGEEPPEPVSARAAVASSVRTAAADSARRPASPLARRRARERGVDLAEIRGSGPGGAVLASDLTADATAPAALPGEPVSVGPLWTRMVERTATSWAGAPHFYLQREARADRLVGWRDALAGQVSGVTFTDLLVKLTAAALRRHPEVNATFEGDRILRHEGIGVGIAVAIEEGLVVPVIGDADALAISEITARRRGLTERARSGSLEPGDVAGGTFTISNLGTHGVDAFFAIVNPPQAAVLAVGRIAPRVVADDGRPVVRPMLTLGLSCDHRVLDGARAARFLETLASLIEEPARLVS